MSGSGLRVVLAVMLVTLAGVASDAATRDRATDQIDDRNAPRMSKAQARRERWPKPVDEFLAGEYLQRADVVLTRRDWDLSSYMIRIATKSPFSHAALVFTGPQFEAGFTNTFIIEAGTGGVDLTDIRDYITDKSTFIAIKRLKQPWFDEPKQARVRGVLLDKIKASYNYWAIGRIFRNLWFGMQRQVRGKEKTIETYRKNNWEPPNDYICSGLVQLGFVEAAIEYIKAGQLPVSALKEVVFHETAASRLPDAADWQYLDNETQKMSAELFEEQNLVELEAVTPNDLARSDKLEWLYLIRNGLVYKVSSYEDVVAQTR